MADDLETTTDVGYLRKGYGIVKTGLGHAGSADFFSRYGPVQEDICRLRSGDAN